MLKAACLVLVESCFTSSATTANPLPCSPARAASIEAFNANKLVWSEISVMACKVLVTALLCSSSTCTVLATNLTLLVIFSNRPLS